MSEIGKRVGYCTAVEQSLFGVLPIENGGTGIAILGSADQVLVVNPAGTGLEYKTLGGFGTVTSVDISGGTTGLTTSGGPITTSGTITLGGILEISNGGTGQSSFSAGYIKSNGSSLSSSLTVAGGDVNGNISGNAANVTGIVAIANGGTGQTSFTSGYIKSNGSALSSSSNIPGSDINGNISGNAGNVSGIVAISNGGTGQTSAADAANALLPNQTGYAGHVLSTNGSGTLSWIATSTGTVTSVNVSGGTTGLTTSGGAITTSGTITLGGTLAIANGGTGQVSFASGYIKSNGSSLSSSATISGGDISGDISGNAANVTGTVAVANGGTGQTTFSAGYIKSNGTSLSSSATISGGDISGNISGNAANVTGIIGIANGGTGQTTATAAAAALLPDQTGNNGKILSTDGLGTLSWISQAGGGGGTVTSIDVSGGTTGLTTSGGPIASSGTITLGGTLAIANGGTGQVSFAIGYIKSDGSTLSSSSIISGSDVSGDISGNAANVTGTVAVANGGTGQTTFSAGYIKSNGSAFSSSSTISVNDLSGTVPLSAGGTGQTSFASGYIKSDGSSLSSSSTISGSDVSGNISGNSSNVTGIVAITNGGTGQTTAANAINALLPDQTSSIGYYLKTNGTICFWAPVSATNVAGNDTEVQYNNSGSFGASSSFTYNNVTATVSTTNITATGALTTRNIYENVAFLTNATGTVVHNFATASIFNHSSITSNFTVNVTNLNLSSTYATNIVLVLNQGSSAYVPTAFEIGGVSQTINWSGGSTPSGNANKIDIVSFSLINNGGTYTVLGQLSPFG